jgi:F-type H+-transporting ATPase subunit gamma
MCGAFNSNLAKAVVLHLQTTYADLLKKENGVRLLTVGKKPTEFFTKQHYTLFAKYQGVFSNLQFSTARTVVEEVVQGYLAGEFDAVEIVYNEFKSIMQPRIVIEQLLPIPSSSVQPEQTKNHPLVDYIFEPTAKEIVDVLLPKHLNYQMWRILLESHTAENASQMTAMNSATENAAELIRSLSLSYNKARQSGITTELTEIVSGVEALKKVG